MKIGILTSGGDCPGINATIRGVCKTAINHYGMEVVGIHSGFQGLLTKEVESFTEKSLSGLLNLGGTMLGTSREKPFRKQGIISDVDKPALIQRNIAELGLDCVVCIGGNGTQLQSLLRWESILFLCPKQSITISGVPISLSDSTRQ